MLTAAQLCTMACQDARKAGSTGTGFSPIAGQKLNLILNKLCLRHDLPANVLPFILTLSGNPQGPAGWVGEQPGIGPYALPASYLRMAQDEVVYSFQGAPQRMVNVDLSEIDLAGMLQLNTNYPTSFATDVGTAPPSLYVWPAPSGAIVLNFRAYILQPDITTPETSSTVPWF